MAPVPRLRGLAVRAQGLSREPSARHRPSPGPEGASPSSPEGESGDPGAPRWLDPCPETWGRPGAASVPNLSPHARGRGDGRVFLPLREHGARVLVGPVGWPPQRRFRRPAGPPLSRAVCLYICLSAGMSPRPPTSGGGVHFFSQRAGRPASGQSLAVCGRPRLPGDRAPSPQPWTTATAPCSRPGVCSVPWPPSWGTLGPT